MMRKFSLFQLSCNLAAFIYCYAAENDPEKFSYVKMYEQNNLVTAFYNDLKTFLKDDSMNSIPYSFSERTNWNFVFESIQNSTQSSSKCLDDIYFILSNSGEPWRLPLLSYSGKFDSSFFQGNTKFLGNYNGCIRVKSKNSNPAFGNFNGKYCTLEMSLSMVNKAVPILIGICVPDTCSADDLVNIIKSLKTSSVLPALNFTGLSCKPTEITLSALGKGVLAVLSLFCVLAVLGSSFTVVDYARRVIEQSPTFSVSDNDCSKEDPDHKKNKNSNGDLSFKKADWRNGNSGSNKVKQILQCFCIFTNGAALLNTDSSNEEFSFFHGIRFLGMSWIILSHAYVFPFDIIGNAWDFFVSFGGIGYQVPLQGAYAVDSFFVVSGFLLAYLTMKKFSETNGVIPWLYFYIHRYVRITSIYLIVLGFFATVFFGAGFGPFWPDSSLDKKCRTNWWWNLLYINNFLPFEDMCMKWSWFLATDMQFFVISPLFLITLWRRPKIGYSLLTTFLVASCFANFLLTYKSNLLAGSGHAIRNAMLSPTKVRTDYMLYLDEIYTKPYTRISPYLIGIALGYFGFKQRVTYNIPKHGLLFLSIGWIAAITTILMAVFGLYKNDLDLLASCFYNSFHRIAFALAESWIIYVCLIGQGGIVDKVLSWKLFTPLSRLSYATYLINPMIIDGYYLSLKTTLHYSHSTVLMLYLSFLVASFALALPVSLIFESPIIRLEKLLRFQILKKEEKLV